MPIDLFLVIFSLSLSLYFPLDVTLIPSASRHDIPCCMDEWDAGRFHSLLLISLYFVLILEWVTYTLLDTHTITLDCID